MERARRTGGKGKKQKFSVERERSGKPKVSRTPKKRTGTRGKSPEETVKDLRAGS